MWVRIATRTGWAVVGMLLLAAVAFEAVKHGGPTVAAALLGLLGPSLARFALTGAPGTECFVSSGARGCRC